VDREIKYPHGKGKVELRFELHALQTPNLFSILENKPLTGKFQLALFAGYNGLKGASASKLEEFYQV